MKFFKKILRPFTKLLPDKFYLSCLYRMHMKRKINFKNPVSFTEKLQWLKLYDRNPEYTTMVDKYLVKDYVAKKIGSEHIIPLLGVWDKFEDIDFEQLPDQFVLKCTHDSAGLVICRDKSRFDILKAKKIINRSLKRNFFYAAREWPYKNVKPRIIAEKYMEDPVTKNLPDYKFFCFDGKVKAMFVATDRFSKTEETKFDFFDSSYHRLPIKNGHPNSDTPPKKPASFDEMKRYAELLSKGIPHVRCDFYEVGGTVYFGELTFYHFGGLVPFEPDEWDRTFGSWIKLPVDKRIEHK